MLYLKFQQVPAILMVMFRSKISESDVGANERRYAQIQAGLSAKCSFMSPTVFGV